MSIIIFKIIEYTIFAILFVTLGVVSYRYGRKSNIKKEEALKLIHHSKEKVEELKSETDSLKHHIYDLKKELDRFKSSLNNFNNE